MASLKTQPTKADVNLFLNSIADEQNKKDSFQLLELFKEVTSLEPTMWGDSIVGFGNYHYKYESGREGDWFLTGFSPRKKKLTIYIMSGFPEFANQLVQLGKHKTSSSCLYIEKLENINLSVLKKIIAESVEKMKKAYP